jgi:hypothetical protein
MPSRPAACHVKPLVPERVVQASLDDFFDIAVDIGDDPNPSLLHSSPERS